MKGLDKKRVFIIFFAIIVSFGVYISESGQKDTKNNERNIGEAVQVTSLPVSGKTIILDAGHGTPDERSGK